VGNPNTGKTSLFNALTGFRRHVANYPGVTVDVARGPVRGSRQTIELIDMPGTYSLAAMSPDEVVLCDALLGCDPCAHRPDAILAIVDAANPQRNLYLVGQLLELGLPTVVALNMVDIARQRGIEVDADRLAKRLGVPVVPVVATDAETVVPLVRALEHALRTPPHRPEIELPAEILQAAASLQDDPAPQGVAPAALRVLIDENGCAEERYLHAGGDADRLRAARQGLRAAGIEPGAVEARARYAWSARILDGVVRRHLTEAHTLSERLDAILTHRVSGILALLLMLYGIFYCIYAGAEPLMDSVEAGFTWLGGLATVVVPEGALRSLVVDGLIAGVGGVLVFLPQILILFLFIAILEDCGYLARAAFMVDRLMRPLGLSGRAFIPLLSSFACAVPAIMGARAIGDRRERFITVLIAPLMSCSARLPVYVLLIGAFVPNTAWLGGWLRLDALVMLGMYLVGIAFAIPAAILLRKTLLAGPPPAFVLELPSFKLPRIRTIWQRVFLAGRSFTARAGTVILLVNLVVWGLAYFPRGKATLQRVEAQRLQAEADGTPWDDSAFDHNLSGAYLRDSYLGRMGHAIEPAIRPLGWDWRVGVAVLASFPAREVVVATLGTILNLGEVEGKEEALQEALGNMTWENSDAPVFTLPVALSVMVFFALCAQCSATLVTMGRELGSWRWPALSFVGMTSLAYAAAWAVSAAGTALGL
jgi:ferrous iron transport protein B